MAKTRVEFSDLLSAARMERARHLGSVLGAVDMLLISWEHGMALDERVARLREVVKGYEIADGDVSTLCRTGA